MCNADTEEARVQVLLDYSVNGERRNYQLAERIVPARATEIVDVEAVIAAGLSDPEGEVIPADVGYGGYSGRNGVIERYWYDWIDDMVLALLPVQTT